MGPDIKQVLYNIAAFFKPGVSKRFRRDWMKRNNLNKAELYTLLVDRQKTERNLHPSSAFDRIANMWKPKYPRPVSKFSQTY